MNRTMSWIKSAFVVIVSTFLTFFAAELGLRLVFPDKKLGQEIRDHSDGYLPRHSAGLHDNPVTDGNITFDSNGFRINPNICPDGKPRKNVLLVGDSNISANFLADDKTLGARLNEFSQNNGVCLDISTFGVSGFGPDQSFFKVAQLTQKKSYDAVLFHVFADNDLGDIVRNRMYVNGALINNGYCYLEKPALEPF